MKVKGVKLNMTHLFKDDRAFGVTRIRLVEPNAVNAFKEGSLVRVRGISKGKGFQGVVKRHGFHGGPKTHGQKNRLRAPGSIGNTSPQRVIPGRHMAGRMGGEQVTVINMRLLRIEPDTQVLCINGAVPGNRGTKVIVEQRP